MQNLLYEMHCSINQISRCLLSSAAQRTLHTCHLWNRKEMRWW